MTDVSWNDKVMQEEIFGPLLPVISFKTFNEAIETIQEKDKPLSAYLFSHDAKEKEEFTTKISFGGGCINDVIMHISNEHLPFGGVGNSGIGNYHGKFGFSCFSTDWLRVDLLPPCEVPMSVSTPPLLLT
jgi:aldehyde dehydrogenase (NAD+)